MFKRQRRLFFLDSYIIIFKIYVYVSSKKVEELLKINFYYIMK